MREHAIGAYGILTLRELVFERLSEIVVENLYFSNQYMLPKLLTNDILIVDNSHSLLIEHLNVVNASVNFFVVYAPDIEGEKERAAELADHLAEYLQSLFEKRIERKTHSIVMASRSVGAVRFRDSNYFHINVNCHVYANVQPS
jgi:hypothetical protein